MLGLVLAVLAGTSAAPAAAHPLSTSAVLLDVGTRSVSAQVELPVDRLAVAFDEPWTAGSVVSPATLAALRSHVGGHLWAEGAGGRRWSTAVSGGRVAVVDGVDHLVVRAVLTPPDGVVGDFTLHDDVILDRIVSHRIFVSARLGGRGTFTTLAMLSWQRTAVPVRAVPASAGDAVGFLTAVRLGVHHIRTGADHLLFLVMLLLPAPALARGRVWVPRGDPGRAAGGCSTW